MGATEIIIAVLGSTAVNQMLNYFLTRQQRKVENESTTAQTQKTIAEVTLLLIKELRQDLEDDKPNNV